MTVSATAFHVEGAIGRRREGLTLTPKRDPGLYPRYCVDAGQRLVTLFADDKSLLQEPEAMLRRVSCDRT